MVKFLYKPITRRYNYGGGRSKSNIKYLVLHWTANTSKGANAMNHYKYFQNNNVGASAHYFVDDEQIIQIVGDSTIAYAVGGNQGYGVALNGATNENSLSVEMCVNNGYSQKMYENTVELFKELKRQYPKAKVCRHWDVTRKDCPHEFTGNSTRWNNFLKDIEKPRKVILDLSKDSVAKPVGEVKSKPKIVIYKGQGDKSAAELIAFKLGCKVIPDDGTLHTPAYGADNYEVVYVGGGKDRWDSFISAAKKFNLV